MSAIGRSERDSCSSSSCRRCGYGCERRLVHCSCCCCWPPLQRTKLHNATSGARRPPLLKFCKPNQRTNEGNNSKANSTLSLHYTSLRARNTNSVSRKIASTECNRGRRSCCFLCSGPQHRKKHANARQCLLCSHQQQQRRTKINHKRSLPPHGNTSASDDFAFISGREKDAPA